MRIQHRLANRSGLDQMIGRVLSLFVTILAIVSAGLAQDPPPTRIGAHVLGETFLVWSKTEGIETKQDCEARRGPLPAYLDEEAGWPRLEFIAKNGKGTFRTTDRQTHQSFRWHFFDGHLADVSTVYIRPDLQQQLSFLVEAYGEPATKRTVQYQNAMGSKWDCLEATWAMPDGSVILARESIENLPRTPPERWLTITFASKDWVAKVEREKVVPVNPYITKPAPQPPPTPTPQPKGPERQPDTGSVKLPG